MRAISRARLTGAMLLLVAACGGDDDGDGGPSTPAGSLQVIQAAESTATLEVLVDGAVVVSGLATGAASSEIDLEPGDRTVSFRRTGGATSPNSLHLAVAADSSYTAVVIDSATVLNPIVLTDTGSTTAAGKTKLQVANFAQLAGPIDVYRRQPDFDSIVTLVFPFAYRTLSGYVQSDPGDWQVLIATEARVEGHPPDVPQDTLLIVEPISLSAGQAVTVVIVDRAGGGLDGVVVRDR